MSTPRSVLFVCVSNRGKSVMAQDLSSTLAKEVFTASSAGTAAAIDGRVNDLSAQVLTEVGVDIGSHQPRQLTDELMRDADLTVVLGSSAAVVAPDGAAVEEWNTDEPSLRGIDGIERMRLIRDDIAARITELTARWLPT
ncbi:arsenate-mycothiol transferase ArsC [Williamsia muralis]|uniref:Low molecular weight phosphatase family protein n=1 Tax=Williamsia marianensis TaxID=85044 RepID=A0ABU4EZP4_WILMA|nr:low molecular weight phosphatase family protein [Williamsia muralis]MDV7136720.1 low molecular weight phosphatase family protein [Williamsia muralis]